MAIFKVNFVKIGIFSEKAAWAKLKVLFSTNFRPKTKKIVEAIFEKNIKVCDFGLIWRRFREYNGNEIFFGKTAVYVSCPYGDEHSCKKSRKSLERFLIKILTNCNVLESTCSTSVTSFACLTFYCSII